MNGTITDRIVRILKEKNIQAKELCDYIGVAQSTFANWKNRGTDPKPVYIPKIAEFLNVSVDFLLTENRSAASEESSAVDINDKLQEIIDVLTGEEGVLWNNEEISEEGRSVLLNWLGHDRDLFDSMRKK